MHTELKNEEFLQSLFHHNPDGVFSLNNQGYFTSVNDRACEISGYTKEELLKMHYHDMVGVDEREKMDSFFQRVLEGKPNYFSTKINKKNGETVNLLLKDIPIIIKGQIMGVYSIAKDITEQKKLEDELWETKEKLDSIINSSADAIIVYDIKDNILKVNKSFQNLFGWSEEEVLGKPVPFILEGTKEELAGILKRVKNGEQISDYETIRVKKDGTTLPVSITLSPIRNGAGKIIAYSGISRDITERKKQEAQLKEIEERFRLITENTTDMINIMSTDGLILYASPSHKDIIGDSPEPYSLINCTDRINYSDLPKMIERQKKFSKYKKPYTAELKIRHLDGHWINLETNVSPILDDKGEIRSIVSVSRDITNRKKTEELVRQGEERYRLIAENTTDLITVIGLDGELFYASPSHKHVLCSDPLQYSNIYNIVHPEDLRKVKSVIKKMCKSKAPQQYETRLKHQNGHYITVESNGMPVLDDENHIQSIVIVSRDVTEKKKTDAILRQSDKLSVLGELAAGIAHEIRNPLTSLKGFTQILRSSVPEGRQYFDIMLSELERINSIVSEFMLLARPQVLDFKIQDIQEILIQVISLLEAQANLHNIQFLVQPIGQLPSINCVKDQLKQVFINILKNAIEAMPNGGTIVIKPALKKDKLTISFIDQGIGIPKDRLKSISEPFYTTKEKGNGLGMMICHKIIENHSGSIDITSKVNVGTTVKVHLPLK